MENKIKTIDRDLLEALLKGGKIVQAKSRTSDKTGVSAHVVIVEMPKGVVVDRLNPENKYWRYLVFLNTPDIVGWWHASSNNLNSTQNRNKAWNEWSELRYYIDKPLKK